jgi:hypothetical protein
MQIKVTHKRILYEASVYWMYLLFACAKSGVHAQ